MKALTAAIAVLSTCGVCAAQQPTSGSVPEGKATAGELPLSLSEAIQRGLKANLAAVVSGERIRAARGGYLAARSELLPSLNAHVAESSQQVNLAAFGFPGIPGINPIVGPFSVFDIRGALSQTIFSLQAIDGTKAANEGIKAAEFSYQDAREAVVLAVTSLYLQAIAGASRIEAGKAQVDAADALYRQAVDFKREGVVPAIDVLRAQVELQSQRQRLISVQNDYDKAKLRLGRAIGLPDGQAIRLTDEVRYTPAPAVTLEEALRQAYESRKDYQSLAARVRAGELEKKAALAGALPTVDFKGDYGAIGQSPASSHGTYSAAIALNIPIFQGGRVRGEAQQADAALAEQRAQLDDLRGRIGYEVRSALLDLKAAGEQVEVSQSAVDLAVQQEAQARDRFAAGVTNNLEVVQAQEAHAAATENLISSLYVYHLAKASLARGTGSAEKAIPSLLSGVHK